MILSPEDKIRLLRHLTRGADDVFASRRDGTWGPVYAPLTDEMVRMHLQGAVEIGSYPLVPVGNGDLPAVWWIAADFDGKTCKAATAERGQCMFSNKRDATTCESCGMPLPDWKRDTSRAASFLLDSNCCLFTNLSRSARGAHVRVLFKEPVPAWLARQWMTAWLEEAGVIVDPDDWDEPAPPSFDRLIPPQDWLAGRLNQRGNRVPGNLAGSPLHGKLARKSGGTLPLNPERVAAGDFEPDGLHWDHVVRALESRAWGPDELEAAMAEVPGSPSIRRPVMPTYGPYKPLPVIHGATGKLDYTLKFCEFAKHMRQPGLQPYSLWVALATQLHRFGDEGRAAFHELSAADPRYDPKDTDQKWEQTLGMRPIRCDTLVTWGYRCPHLWLPRCNGARAPTYFADHTDAEIL